MAELLLADLIRVELSCGLKKIIDAKGMSVEEFFGPSISKMEH